MSDESSPLIKAEDITLSLKFERRINEQFVRHEDTYMHGASDLDRNRFYRLRDTVLRVFDEETANGRLPEPDPTVIANPRSPTTLGCKNSADECRKLGWSAGTLLVGDEGSGPAVIKITAVGEETILAREISFRGLPTQYTSEGCWTLSFRDWKEQTDA